jgi:hypothetical protein
MTMSRFCTAPNKGHLERLKIIFEYLQQFKSAAIRVRIEESYFSSFPVQEFNWLDKVYANVKEDIARDTPERLGKPVVLVCYVDANLYHDMLTGGSVTGILFFCNKLLGNWFS